MQRVACKSQRISCKFGGCYPSKNCGVWLEDGGVIPLQTSSALGLPAELLFHNFNG